MNKIDYFLYDEIGLKYKSQFYVERLSKKTVIFLRYLMNKTEQKMSAFLIVQGK